MLETTTVAEATVTRAMFGASELKRVVGNAALFAAPKTETLRVLTGVLLRFDGRTLTATASDRYTMGEDKLETATGGDFPLPAWSIVVPAATLVAALKPADAWITLEVIDDTLVVDYFDGVRRIRALEGNYPKTDTLWPLESGEVGLMSFNPRFLARLDKVKTGPNPIVRLTFGTRATLPVVATFRGDNSFRALILPTRGA